jgi:hypothetical protein
MKSDRRIEERLDAFLEESMNRLERAFAESAGEPPNLKEIAAAVVVVKRIQEAYRAVHLDVHKREAGNTDGEHTHGMDHEEISRMLRLLEENGTAGEANGANEEPV